MSAQETFRLVFVQLFLDGCILLWCTKVHKMYCNVVLLILNEGESLDFILQDIFQQHFSILSRFNDMNLIVD